jgi:hypothetical protein
VAVARSLSVTRATSQRAIAVVRPIRSSSRQVHVSHVVGGGEKKHAAVVGGGQPYSSTTSLASSSSATSLSPSSSLSSAGAVKAVGGRSVRLVDGPPSPAIVVVGSSNSSGAPNGSDSHREDLQRELFGERGLGERRGLAVGGRTVEEKVREIGAQLTPRMCVVEEEENRKSVWGLIESA